MGTPRRKDMGKAAPADGHGEEQERARLAALASYAILDTPPEPSFDAAVRFAARICEAPIALLSFHDARRQWFKARIGIDLQEAPRESAFFPQGASPPAGAADTVLVVPDARDDPRFFANPYVAGKPNIRFYAGAPLIDGAGYRLGMVCVIDSAPRPAGLTSLQREALETIAQQIVTQLELRREVRQREIAEHRLRASEARLAAGFVELEEIYRHAPVGLFAFDRELRCMRVNDRMSVINGLTHEQQIGHTLDEILPELAPRLRALYNRVLERGETIIDMEVVGETRATPGEQRHWLCSYFPLRDGAGAIVGLTGAVLDVTDRKRTELDLVRARERLSLALESAAEGHWDWDIASNQVWMSDRWCEMLGYSREELQPDFSTWQRLVHPDDRPDALAVLSEHLDGLRETFESEHRMRTKSGEWLWVLARGKVVDRASDGRPLRAVGTQGDIGARKRAEQERLFMFRLNEALRDRADASERMAAATQLLRAHLGVAQVGFGEIEEADGELVIQRESNDGRVRPVVGRWPLERFGPAFVDELQQGAAIAIADVATDHRVADPAIRQAFEDVGARAVLDVPLIRRGALVAMLFIHDPEPRAWSATDLSIVEATCDRLWSAVERARAEERLRTSEEMLRQAVRVRGLGVFDHDHLRDTLYWSPEMRTIVGIGPDDPISVPGYVAMVHDEDRPALAAAIAGAHDPRGDGLCDLPHRLIRPSGEVRHVSVRSQTYFEPDAAGTPRPARTVGVLLDMSEEFEAQAALRHSEMLLGAVLDSLPVGVVITDAQGGVVRDNAAHRALWGRHGDPGDFGDYDAWIGWWPDSGARIRPLDWPLARALFQQETTRSTLIEVQRFDSGERRFCLNSSAPVLDEGGGLLGAVAVEHDVTDAIFADRRLRETEERFRLALSATRDAIWDWDLQTDQIVWNDAVTTLFGYAPGDVDPSADWWKARVHPEDRERVIASLDAAIFGGDRDWSAEYRFRRADGGHAYVLDRGTVLRDPRGRPLRAIGAMLDLTERKAAEAELAQAQEDLLRISRLTAMGAVASTLAHELNQPLTASANFLALLKIGLADLPDAGRMRETVDRATSEVIRAGEIVRRIRRFASTGELTRRPESVAAMLARAWDSVGQLSQARGLQPQLELDPSADLVEVDRVQIEQVLNNLLRNAVEAMDGAPARRLTVRGRRRGASIEVAIEDSGTGLSAETKAHLFEPFRSSKAAGLGLGLPLCRSIVEAHGGRIWAEDGAGGGARFVLQLPGADLDGDPGGKAETMSEATAGQR